jgi:hypothetical protein
MSAKTIKILNFMRRVMDPRKVLNLSHLVPDCGYHRPRPSFSFSAYVLLPRLNLGKLLEIFRACLEKNPLLRVEKEGYPFTSSLRAFAEAQVTPFVEGPPLICKSPYAFLGEDLPLKVSYGLVKPGLDHPPPALGEGDRDNDMSEPSLAGCDFGGTLNTGRCAEDAPRRLAFSAPRDPDGALTLDDRRLRLESGRFLVAVVSEDARL